VQNLTKCPEESKESCTAGTRGRTVRGKKGESNKTKKKGTTIHARRGRHHTTKGNIHTNHETILAHNKKSGKKEF